MNFYVKILERCFFNFNLYSTLFDKAIRLDIKIKRVNLERKHGKKKKESDCILIYLFINTYSFIKLWVFILAMTFKKLN